MKKVEIRGLVINFEHNDGFSFYEKEVLDYIDSIPNDENLYDLGACLGYFSMYADKKGLDVYCFEVEDKNFIGLNDNIKLNNCNVKAYNVGISDGKSKTMELMIGQDWFGGRHKTLNTNNFVGMEGIKHENYRKKLVTTYSLDEFILENELPQPQNIKVDIDGSEYDFLIGSPKSLGGAKTMMIEMNLKSKKYEEMIDIILSYGFKIKKSYQISQPNCEFLHNIWFVKQ